MASIGSIGDCYDNAVIEFLGQVLPGRVTTGAGKMDSVAAELDEEEDMELRPLTHHL